MLAATSLLAPLPLHSFSSLPSPFVGGQIDQASTTSSSYYSLLPISPSLPSSISSPLSSTTSSLPSTSQHSPQDNSENENNKDEMEDEEEEGSKLRGRKRKSSLDMKESEEQRKGEATTQQEREGNVFEEQATGTPSNTATETTGATPDSTTNDFIEFFTQVQQLREEPQQQQQQQQQQKEQQQLLELNTIENEKKREREREKNKGRKEKEKKKEKSSTKKKRSSSIAECTSSPPTSTAPSRFSSSSSLSSSSSSSSRPASSSSPTSRQICAIANCVLTSRKGRKLCHKHQKLRERGVELPALREGVSLGRSKKPYESLGKTQRYERQLQAKEVLSRMLADPVAEQQVLMELWPTHTVDSIISRNAKNFFRSLPNNSPMRLQILAALSEGLTDRTATTEFNVSVQALVRARQITQQQPEQEHPVQTSSLLPVNPLPSPGSLMQGSLSSFSKTTETLVPQPSPSSGFSPLGPQPSGLGLPQGFSYDSGYSPPNVLQTSPGFMQSGSSVQPSGGIYRDIPSLSVTYIPTTTPIATRPICVPEQCSSISATDRARSLTSSPSLPSELLKPPQQQSQLLSPPKPMQSIPSPPEIDYSYPAYSSRRRDSFSSLLFPPCSPMTPATSNIFIPASNSVSEDALTMTSSDISPTGTPNSSTSSGSVSPLPPSETATTPSNATRIELETDTWFDTADLLGGTGTVSPTVPGQAEETSFVVNGHTR